MVAAAGGQRALEQPAKSLGGDALLNRCRANGIFLTFVPQSGQLVLGSAFLIVAEYEGPMSSCSDLLILLASRP
jgi:hypothetical protein